LAFAIEHELTLANTSFRQYAPHFETTSRDLLCRYPPRSSPLARSKRARQALFAVSRVVLKVAGRCPTLFGRMGVATLDPDDARYDLGNPRLLELARRAWLIFTSGWGFGGEFYLLKHAQAVKDFFRPLPRIRTNVDTLTDRARERSDVLVGIHLRQGDYRHYLGGRRFYPTAAYAKLMFDVRGLFDGRVGFLVCSNEPQDRSRFDGLDVTFGSGHLIEDLYSLARCDYILGPESSYSLWASFYGDTPRYVVDDPHRVVALGDFTLPYRLVRRRPGG
jgi:hypothetical protein